MAILIGMSIFVSRNLSLSPGMFQAFIEFVVGGLYSVFEGILGHNIKKYFPIIASFFIFIIVSNWIGLIPGVGHALTYNNKEETLVSENTSHGVVEQEDEENKESPALLRAPTADLNTTLAFALISFFLIQYAGFKSLGASYSKKFFNFSGGIPFYVGLLETISELGKIISFAFRLYGNIFAGEVLLLVIATIVPVWAFFAPLPFIGLEIFVGFIQALVFSMLTAVFLSVATLHQEH